MPMHTAELQGLHALLLDIKGLCALHAITSGLVIMDMTIWECSTKLSKTRSSHHAALPMQILSELSTQSTILSLESQSILST